MTKNELQDAFMESLSLDEGNRKNKKMLYGNPDVATTDILLELLFDDYDIIGNSEWLAKVIKFIGKRLLQRCLRYNIYLIVNIFMLN